jgi:hypothetical protein
MPWIWRGIFVERRGVGIPGLLKDLEYLSLLGNLTQLPIDISWKSVCGVVMLWICWSILT